MVNPLVRSISERELLENLAWVQALARGLVSDPGRADDVPQDAWLRALEGSPRGPTGRGRSWSRIRPGLGSPVTLGDSGDDALK